MSGSPYDRDTPTQARETLFEGAPRPVQTALMEGCERPVGPMPGSLFLGDNAGLIASIAPLYLTGSVLDVTYGQGAWWRRFTPSAFAHHDLADDGVDFRALPYEDDAWDTVCFDPPYIPSRAMHTSTKRGRTHRLAYGLTERRSRTDVETLFAEGLVECARVARRFVLAKCCDYSEGGGSFVLGHVSAIAAGETVGLRVADLIVHGYFNAGGPTNPTMRRVKRTRRTHSYLIVFRSPRRRARRAAA